MRTLDWKYIQNLATQAIGDHALSQLKLEYRDGVLRPRSLYHVLHQKISEKVEAWNGETLGRVCMFARKDGMRYAHDPKDDAAPYFISATGYGDVLKREDLVMDVSGEEFMKKLAVATLVGVIRDMVVQRQLLEKWREEDTGCPE